MVSTVQLVPRRVDFASLAAVRQAFPDLKLPSPLPANAKFALALWQYPPDVVTREINGRTEVVSTDYNIAPTLQKGHVQVVFKVGEGSLIVDQGLGVPFANPNNPQTGIATSRRLANGRTVYTKSAQGSQFPMGRLQLVVWLSDRPSRQFVLSSNVLSVDELSS